jgi:hypothetical protein
MQAIPLVAIPSQMLNVVLSRQQCRIAVYQKTTGLFFNLAVDDLPVITTAYCADRTRLVRHEYLGFVGNLSFVDTKGKSDPDCKGLGSRYVLVYLEPSDL